MAVFMIFKYGKGFCFTPSFHKKNITDKMFIFVTKANFGTNPIDTKTSKDTNV